MTGAKTMSAKRKLFYIGLPVISIACICMLGIIQKQSLLDVTKTCVFSLMLTMIMEMYLYLHDDILYRMSYFRNDKIYYPAAYILMGLYFLSFLCMLIPDGYVYLWFFGSCLSAMLLDMQLGLLFHFNLTYIAVAFWPKQFEIVLYLIIVGVLICVLSNYMKKKLTAIYCTVIILSMDIIMNLILHNFAIREVFERNHMISFMCIFISLLLSYIIYEWCEKKFNIVEPKVMEIIQKVDEKDNMVISKPIETSQIADDMKEKKNEITKTQNESNEIEKVAVAQTTDEVAATVTKPDLTKELQEILADDFPLHLRMKDYSKDLYKHSRHIAELSSKAAAYVGANTLLAKAGGFYHEVGKISGQNYIEEGVKLAKEYQLPAEVQSIIRQHNIKYEKPTSTEAVIVMFADNILSSIEYISQSKDKKASKLSPEKIIHQIFQLRLEKGTFEEAGISLNSYKRLLEFFTDEFKVAI